MESESHKVRERKHKDSNGTTAPGQSNAHNETLKEMKAREREERESFVLWRRPGYTLCYFLFELGCVFSSLLLRLSNRKKIVFISLLLLAVLVIIHQIDGTHQNAVQAFDKHVLWLAYWCGLGILSSVGLGTGLHTFLLYLGPHIAAVTLAAYECMSTNFPEPPYPNEIICPEKEEKGMTMWTIMSKVRLEAVMWGAGTAIGELPPYFMARAARLSGTDEEEEDLEELETLIHEKKSHPEELGFLERAKLYVHNLVQRVGFFGILACASIPNPLFDLAGITCGHFLVPFWTFFGATLIGKAIIKMHIQKLFVIFMFSKHHVERVVDLLKYIPKVGPSLQTPFQLWLEQQKKKLHHKPGTTVGNDENILSWIFEKVIIVMVAYFLLSIINSMAQSYHKRLCKAHHAVGDSTTVKVAKRP